ncbi:MAG TPA: hypothetical protein VLT58_15620 [Polyangia bacterium]|nr:hypothetical protein [Polyangia bacterium]
MLQVESNFVQLTGSVGPEPASAPLAAAAARLAPVNVLQLGIDAAAAWYAAFESSKHVLRSPTVAWHVAGSFDVQVDDVVVPPSGCTQPSYSAVQAACRSASLGGGLVKA